MKFEVTLVYLPEGLSALEFHIPYLPGMKVSDVLVQSQIIEIHPEVASLAVGIFSERVALTTLVKPGDRIEIYRPLIIDPKEKRRQRALDK